jgi:aspartyl-tRNA(Asn)/glutamyl-tRNA(Gln) amidotransferase subunit B
MLLSLSLSLCRPYSRTQPHHHQVVSAYPSDVARYRSGEVKLKRFFVGEVMKSSKGRADPKIINQLLERHLAEPQE